MKYIEAIVNFNSRMHGYLYDHDRDFEANLLAEPQPFLIAFR